MGTQCETCTSCTTIEFVSKIDAGSSFLASTLGDYMVRLDTSPNEPIEVYGHPVYYHGVENEDGSKTVSADPLVILLYTGGEYWIWNLDINSIGGRPVKIILSTFLAPSTQHGISKKVRNHGSYPR